MLIYNTVFTLSLMGAITIAMNQDVNHPLAAYPLPSGQPSYLWDLLLDRIRQSNTQWRPIDNVPRIRQDSSPRVFLAGVSNPVNGLVSSLERLQTAVDNLFTQRTCPGIDYFIFGQACITIGHSCYCLFRFEKTFDDAAAFCRTAGFDGLASLQNKRKASALTDMFSGSIFQKNVWTSGSDAASEGKFVWTTTGESFTDTNWAPGRPTNSKDANCVALNYLTSEGQWTDESCGSLNQFICEFGKVSNPVG